MTNIRKKLSSYTVLIALLATSMFAVSCDGSSTPKLKSFTFTAAANPQLNRDTVGVINSSANSIQISVPIGTDLTTLVATYEAENVTNLVVKVGGDVQINGLTPNDFTNPVDYVVNADGFSQTFNVAVYESSVWQGNLLAKSQAELDQLKGFTSMTGYLQILDSQIENLDALSSLTNIDGNLSIMRNEQLDNVDGLSNLTRVGGNLQFMDNSVLRNINGLEKLESVDFFTIYRCVSLTNERGLTRLTSIPSFMTISGTAITNVDFLSNLKTVGRSLSINSNHSLVDVSGLANLTSAGAHPDGGGLRISENNSLKVIEGIDNLSFSRTLFISANPALTTVKGFAKVDTVEDVFFSGNDTLTDIEEFKSLTRIRARLYVNNNGLLADLSFLKNLTQVDDSFNIYSNPSLPNSLALALRDQTSIGGEVKIQDNME